jgi:transcriptional regulator with XRE-family HTH domain
MTLSERLRKYRAEKNLSLRALGQQLGMSYAFLSDLEMGRREPGNGTRKKLAELFGIAVHQLDAPASKVVQISAALWFNHESRENYLVMVCLREDGSAFVKNAPLNEGEVAI